MPILFLSYSRSNLQHALELNRALAQHGVSVWRDQHSIYGGDQWPKAIGEAIARSDALLLIWSKEAAASHFVEFEWVTALALKKIIIPCLLDETALPPSLTAINSLPYRDIDDTLTRILAALGTRQQVDPARQTQVISRLQGISATSTEDVLNQVKTLFAQDNWNVRGDVIQAGRDVHVTIRDGHNWFAPAVSTAALAVIALLGYYYYTQHTHQNDIRNPVANDVTYLRGQVNDTQGNPLAGVLVKVDEITGEMPVQTTTTASGGFIIDKLPAKVGDRVRVYVTKEGYRGHDEYVALPGPLSVQLKEQQ